MNKLIALLTIFVAQGALAGICQINTVETYIYTGEVTRFPVLNEESNQGVADCYRKGQQTADFVKSSNYSGSVEVVTTAQYIYDYNRGVSPMEEFFGREVMIPQQWETMYPFLVVGDAYLGLYSAYHYHNYGYYPVGVHYTRPGVIQYREVRRERISQVEVHRTTYETRTRQTTQVQRTQVQRTEVQHTQVQHGREQQVSRQTTTRETQRTTTSNEYDKRRHN